MALVISTWCWGTKYPAHYADRLEAGVRRHLSVPYRFKVYSPEPEDEQLVQMPGCFARLRAFDPAWQAEQGLSSGDRLVCIDLDAIVTGSLDGLFEGDAPFRILQGANASNPCPYNGSVWYVDAGYRADAWSDFSIDAAAAVPHFAFPDDQAWLAHKVPDADGWQAGPSSGVYAFHKPGWPRGRDDLPAGARLVVFPGWRDPSAFEHLPWVRENWRT